MLLAAKEHKENKKGNLNKTTTHMSDILIIELKACRTIVDEHISQLLGYLRASRREHGLLVNFGSYKFQIKKYIMTQHRISEDPEQKNW